MTTLPPRRRIETPLTRRRLLRTACAGLGSLSLGSHLAGCTSETEPTEDGPPQTPEGRTLSVAQTFVNDQFDPARTTGIEAIIINRHIYRSLYRQNPFSLATDLTPDLAVDMPEEIDDTTYRVTLRDDVTFHDGSPLTADDIVFTFEHYMDPDVLSFLTRFYETLFDSITATDTHEIEIKLKSPTTLLADRLAIMQIISESAATESPNALELEPVGTGPYQVTSAVALESATLERFADYTGDVEYHLDKVNYTQTLEAAARVAGLYSGRFDVITVAPDSAYDEISSSDGYNIEAVPSYFATYMLFHCGRPPFDDVRVRQAVLYAIDRDAIIAASYFGQAEPAWDGEIHTDDPDYARPDVIYEYDPDRAKQLMTDSGLGGDNPIPIELHGLDFEYITSQLPIIQENLREIGLEPKLVSASSASPTDGVADLFVRVSDPSAFTPDAEFRLRWLYYGVVPREFAHLDDDTATKIETTLDNAYAAADDTSRRQFLAEAQNLAQELVPYAPLHRRKNLTAWSDRLHGFQTAPTVGVMIDGVSA